MAYDKKKIYQQAEEVIKKHNLFFIEDIVAFLPCSKQTFYDFFPINSDELDTLKDLLDDNKVKTKSSIRAKLWKSNKASELLALYRLIATPEEHKKLNQSYVDHSNKGEKFDNMDLKQVSTEDLERLLKEHGK
jgi:hypothetical protein